uniref:Uncharacterized protein n=1 Tax=Acrobeloides nanus TaxID=290746 RepID=A0A914C6Y8_9BILA
MKFIAILFIFVTLVAMASSATYPLAGQAAAQTCICTRLGGVCKLNKFCNTSGNVNIKLTTANGANICTKSWVVCCIPKANTCSVGGVLI